MKQVEGIHLYSELPAARGPMVNHETNKISWLLHRDKGVVEFLEQTFTTGGGCKKFLGHGRFGTVIGLSDSVAVKILEFRLAAENKRFDPLIVIRDVQQELFIACQLNALQKFTPALVRTHGWLISQHIPLSWKPFVKLEQLEYKDVEKHSYMLMFMEHIAHPFDSKKALVTGYLNIIFILLHALYVAKRELGFNHSDLHMGNIMLEVTSNRNVILPMNDKLSFNVNLPDGYIPKIIDFGFSKTNLALDGGRWKNDVATLFGAVEARAVKYSPDLDMSNISSFTDYEWPLEDLLIKHPIFDSIRRMVVA
jgi:hypothetical protein